MASTGGGRPADGERGAGTALLLGVALAVVLLLAGILLMAQALVASARASTAADLSALAAADAVRGLRPANPCGLADETAGRNGARMGECLLDEAAGTATVTVRVPVPALAGMAVTGTAHAGPPAAGVVDGPPPTAGIAREGRSERGL